MWHKITIRQFQQVYPLLKKQFTDPIADLDNQIEVISILENLSIDYLNNKIHPKDFKALQAKYRFLYDEIPPGKCPRKFKLKGITYTIDYNPRNVHLRFRAHDIVDLTTLAQDPDKAVEQMHIILAKYVTPSRSWFWGGDVDVSESMLDLNVQTASNINAFFLTLLENCLPVMASYSRQRLEKLNKQMEGLIAGAGS